MEFLTKIADILKLVEVAADGSLVSDAADVVKAIEEVILDFKNKVDNSHVPTAE